jgi:hypothetical protein
MLLLFARSNTGAEAPTRAGQRLAEMRARALSDDVLDLAIAENFFKRLLCQLL